MDVKANFDKITCMDIRNFFKNNRKVVTRPTPMQQKNAVTEAARSALKKYEKTFIDLARYDRGVRATCTKN